DGRRARGKGDQKGEGQMAHAKISFRFELARKKLPSSRLSSGSALPPASTGPASSHEGANPVKANLEIACSRTRLEIQVHASGATLRVAMLHNHRVRLVRGGRCAGGELPLRRVTPRAARRPAARAGTYTRIPSGARSRGG